MSSPPKALLQTHRRTLGAMEQVLDVMATEWKGLDEANQQLLARLADKIRSAAPQLSYTSRTITPPRFIDSATCPLCGASMSRHDGSEGDPASSWAHPPAPKCKWGGVLGITTDQLSVIAASKTRKADRQCPFEHLGTETLRSGNIRVDVRDKNAKEPLTYNCYFRQGEPLFVQRTGAKGTRKMRGSKALWAFATPHSKQSGRKLGPSDCHARQG